MEQWEDEVLGEAVKALAYHRRWGMGLIQWCARGVRGEMGKVLWAARCALLKEHASQLAEVYKGQSKLLASRVLQPQHVGLADGYWLACEDIAKIWGTLI